MVDDICQLCSDSESVSHVESLRFVAVTVNQSARKLEIDVINFSFCFRYICK